MFNVHYRYYYIEKNPCLVGQQHFQRKFLISVWIDIIDGILINPFLVLPLTSGVLSIFIWEDGVSHYNSNK